MKIESAYISGALTVTREDVDIRSYYGALGDMCGKLGLEAYIPHLHGDPADPDNTLSSEYIWRQDHREVVRSDLLIAYVGMPSLGTGAELEIARITASDIILWWFEGERVSRMARGNPAVVSQFIVKNQHDLLEDMSEFIKKRYAGKKD